jgi:hypothetical protein
MANSLLVDEQTRWISGVRTQLRKPYASSSLLAAMAPYYIQKE